MGEQRRDRNRRLILVAVAVLAGATTIGYWERPAGDMGVRAVEPGHAHADAAAAVANSIGHPGAPVRERSAPRPRSSATLPPPGTPLVQIYDDLKRRADAGDAQAASRLYREVHSCAVLRRFNQLIALVRSAAADNGNAWQPENAIAPMPDNHQSMKQMQEVLDYVRDNAARCDGVTDAHIASMLPVTLQAAKLGDLKATECYIASEFDMMDGLLDHPEWLAQYRMETPALVDAALLKGDWVVVELMRHAYSGAFANSPRGQLFSADPVMDYRYLKLERLGASGDFATKQDVFLARAAAQLSPDQVAASDAWASATFSRYFNSSSNDVSNGANICQIDDD